MALFKVGDAVKVRDDLVLYARQYNMIPPDSSHRGWVFVGSMQRLCGKYVTITYADKTGYHIAEDDGYWWSDEMFDTISSITEDELDIEECDIAQYLG